MAKVEQFPDQTGENGITENVKDQKTREIFDSGRRRGNSSMPDDSLLMGSSTGQNPAREPAGQKADKKAQGTDPHLPDLRSSDRRDRSSAHSALFYDQAL